MIACKDCEHCKVDEHGRRSFSCDPFNNVKETDCIQKWQLIRLDMLLASYQTILSQHQKLAPMQNKMLKFMEREIDEANESEKWKIDDSQDDNQDDNSQDS